MRKTYLKLLVLCIACGNIQMLTNIVMLITNEITFVFYKCILNLKVT